MAALSLSGCVVGWLVGCGWPPRDYHIIIFREEEEDGLSIYARPVQTSGRRRRKKERFLLEGGDEGHIRG